MARAIQCFVPGVPQVYYVGLLAGQNDMELLRRTGVGRDINRHYYTAHEVDEQLARPVVQRLVWLLKFRNTHPAFAGSFAMVRVSGPAFAMEWRHDADWARLDVNLAAMQAAITCSCADPDRHAPVWSSTTEP